MGWLVQLWGPGLLEVSSLGSGPSCWSWLTAATSDWLTLQRHQLSRLER